VKPDTAPDYNGPVFIVNQVEPGSGKFDEHKVIIGARSEKEAQQIYDAHFSDGSGPQRRRTVGMVTVQGFKAWLKDGDTKKPFTRAPKLQGPKPEPARAERRTDSETRKRVDEMSPAEMKAEIERLRNEGATKDKAARTDRMTGLHNGLWLEENKSRFSHFVALDADGLKWINDNMGHDSGDKLLRAYGQALANASENSVKLRDGGDEFFLLANSQEEADNLVRQVEQELAAAEITATVKGERITVKGIGVSYGIGQDLEAADTRLNESKREREASGQRAGRNQQPPSVVREAASRREDSVDQDAGRDDNRVSDATPQTPSSEGVSASGARKSRLTPLNDARLKDVATQDALRSLDQEIGWAEVGGKILRDGEGDVVGRTSWIPKSPFWPGRPAAVTEAAARGAVERAITGEPLTAAQKRFVTYALDYLARETNQFAIEAEAIESFQEEIDKLTDEEQDALNDVIEDARRSLGELAVGEIQERAAIESTGAQAYAEYLRSQIREALNHQENRQEARQPAEGESGARDRPGQQGRGKDEAAGESAAPVTQQTPATAGVSASDAADFNLSGETEREIKARERRESIEREAAERKAIADRERDQFTLQPTNQPASVAKQTDMFGDPSPEEVLQARIKARSGFNAGGSLFSRGRATTGLEPSEVKAVLQRIGVEGNVVATEADLPLNLRMSIKSQGAEGQTNGLYDPLTGEIWINASRMDSMTKATVVALHESAHRGLRKLFGTGLDVVLNSIYATNENVRTQAGALMRKYRYTRERATEEVLADMAYSANAKKLVGWQRLVAFIRDWLAKRGIAINFTDDMVELIVAGAVEQGKRTATSPLTDPRLNASFSREAVKGPVFVSSLTEAIGRMMQATAPAATWKGAINNLTQKGVKAEEIEWSGVREWLDMQTGKVSKDALLAYLSNNGVQIQETELGGASAAEWQKAADAVNKAIRDRLPESEVDLLRDVRDELRDKLNSPVETKFSGYQLPGGENYRELLLTLPNKKKEAKRIQQFAERVAQVLDVSDQEARGISADILSGELDPYSAGLPPNLAGDFAAVRDAGNPIAPDFKSSHFDQPNILAHIRFNERTDADGKRVLFLEEIQSDWAQQGKRAGFANAATLGKLKNLQRVYDEAGKRAEAAWDAARAAMKRNDFLGFDNGGEAWEAVHSHADWETRWDVNPEDLSPIREYALAERARRTANNEMALLRDGVPTAPFVGKTEAWVALALKRMIRYAAENGFDRVAWTTGDQQAERYDLSKHIDRLHYEPAGEGKFEVIAFKKGAQDDSTGSEVFHEDEIDLKRIEDVFGKEIAAKIKDGAGQKIGGGYRDWHEMKGVDLKVGGEGMRAFYDKIVPNVANDVLRKLGGGRVATVAVAGDVDLHPWKVRDATDDGSGQIEAEYRTEKLAREHAEEQGGVFVRYEPGGGTEQHGFDITPALRVRSLEGVPLFSRGDGWKSAVTQKRIAEEVGNFLYTTRTFNAFHKTVGTQMHKAKVDTIPGRNPGDSGTFGKVYNIGQSYLRDVSRFANESADLAPDVLPQIRDVKDAFSFATRATKADIAAVSKVVFEGTLDKMLYSPAELKRLGLTDNQVEMYGQTREAINHSLDMLVSAEAARIAKDEVPRTVIMEAKEKPYTGAMLIAQALSDKATEKQADLPAYADRLRDLADEIRQKMERVSELKAEAYAPLMRFGQHTIYVTEKNDEGKSVQLYFGMYESAAQANRAAKVLAEEYPGADITRGILSQDSYKMFQGLSPDTLELFADLVTVEVEGETVPISQTDLYQQYLKLAVNNRSALKRMIKRKGVAGYSEDVSRVLAAFLTSNARAAAGNYHLGEMLEAVNQIPKEKGDVKDEAIALMKYLQNPQDEAAGLRSFMFIQYLGGSVASAMVNTTQPLTMTLPYLSQFGMVEAVRALKDGLAMATGMKPITSESLKAALEKAHTEGVTNPQEIHQLQAEASRNLGSSLALRKGLTLWGSLFALAEQFNRKSTFIAAFEMATAKKMPDAYRFAVNAVEETQGVYNRGNRPNLGRGALGATLLTFKQFSISYLEFLKRLPNREKALALAILMLAAGMQGLPFADDLDDVIDTIAQSLGYSFNTEDAKRKFLTRTFGEGFAGFVLYGASALPGVPLDIQGRMGLGNLIPGTGILKRSETDKTRDLVEVLGPVGGLAKGVAGAATELQGGDIKGAAMHALPVAIQNVLKGYDMAQLGMYRDLKGRKVMDTDAYEAFIKTVGFQPADVARESRRIQLAQQDVSLAKRVESEIVEAWAQGVFEKDFKKSAKAMEKLRDWNEKNPESLIRIQPSQIQRRLREMMRTRQERFVKAAPAELRGQVNADTR
jgi:diguanylate cyclase (GGDEF)-like protein